MTEIFLKSPGGNGLPAAYKKAKRYNRMFCVLTLIVGLVLGLLCGVLAASFWGGL